MNYAAYLQKIACQGDFIPSIITLKRLQKNHLLHIPFENLDIYYGKPIPMDMSYIFDKVIRQHRGGFCYELNALFYHLLVNMGFEARLISGRVYHKVKGYGPEFDHLAIIVTIDSMEYLVDVGYGEFAFHPVAIDLDRSQKDKRGTFKISQYSDTHLAVNIQKMGKWNPIYLFSPEGREYKDFEEMCSYHQTSPESHFTQKRICSLATEEGRITVTGNRLVIKDSYGLKTTSIKDQDEFLAYLFQYFQIEFREVLEESLNVS